jgi:hypothetical protein
VGEELVDRHLLAAAVHLRLRARAPVRAHDLPPHGHSLRLALLVGAPQANEGRPSPQTL